MVRGALLIFEREAAKREPDDDSEGDESRDREGNAGDARMLFVEGHARNFTSTVYFRCHVRAGMLNHLDR